MTIGSTPMSGGWPLAVTVSGGRAVAPSGLSWAAGSEIGGDGTVNVRAQFTATGNPTTDTVGVLVDTKQFGYGYATAGAGPGSVNLITGNYTVSDTDASMSEFGSDLAFTRSFNSQDAGLGASTAQTILGPGWRASVAASASTDWAELADVGYGAFAVDTDGGVTGFVKSGSSYQPLGEAAGLSLTKNTATDTWTLASPDGESVTFKVKPAQPATGTVASPRRYALDTVVQPGSATTSWYAYDAAGRISMILAPTTLANPASTCVLGGTSPNYTWPAGCQGLKFNYGTYGGQTRLAAVTGYTGSATGTLVYADLACYDYSSDANARLVATWDPRTVTPGGAQPKCADSKTKAVLKTQYGYDASGRIATLTPPGLGAWTLGYDPANRFASAAQGGLATQVDYTAAIGTATGPTDDTHPDLSPAAAAAWGQTDTPVGATAVFPPGHDPATLTTGTVHAYDASGREVNTATFLPDAGHTGQAGWRVTTTEYDGYGNTVRALGAANRDQALGSGAAAEAASLGLPGATSDVLAQALSQLSYYTADGVDQLDTYGPLHPLTLPDGTAVTAREHTRTTYGTLTAPGSDPTVNGPAHLPTVTTTAASIGAATPVAPSAAGDVDVRTTTSKYALSASDTTGWTFKTPQQVIVDPGGGAAVITTQTRYDPATGDVVEQRQPSAAGSPTSPGTRASVYFTGGAENLPGCVSWRLRGLVCHVGPAAQAGGGQPDLPITWYGYDWLGRVTTATGTALGATSYGYNTATGQPETLARDGAVLTTAHDTTFGRVVAFTDADGGHTTTGYDPATGLVSASTAKTSPTGATVSATGYTYDAAGQVAGQTFTAGSATATISLSRDGDGAVTAETVTGQLSFTRTYTRDETGQLTHLGVVHTAGAHWYDQDLSYNVHGQVRTDSATTGDRAYPSVSEFVHQFPVVTPSQLDG